MEFVWASILVWIVAIGLALIINRWLSKEYWEHWGVKNKDMKTVLASLSIIFAAAVIGTLVAAAMEVMGKNLSEASFSFNVLFDVFFLGIVAILILFGAIISLGTLWLLKQIFNVE